MRHRKFDTNICVALTNHDRATIIELDDKQKASMGEIIRGLLTEGLKARGVA